MKVEIDIEDLPKELADKVLSKKKREEMQERIKEGINYFFEEVFESKMKEMWEKIKVELNDLGLLKIYGDHIDAGYDEIMHRWSKISDGANWIGNEKELKKFSNAIFEDFKSKQHYLVKTYDRYWGEWDDE